MGHPRTDGRRPLGSWILPPLGKKHSPLAGMRYLLFDDPLLVPTRSVAFYAIELAAVDIPGGPERIARKF